MASPSSSGSSRRPAGRPGANSTSKASGSGARSSASSTRGSTQGKPSPRSGDRSGKPRQGGGSSGKPWGDKPGKTSSTTSGKPSSAGGQRGAPAKGRGAAPKGKGPAGNDKSPRPSSRRPASDRSEDRAFRPRRELTPEEVLYRGIPEEITGEELDRRVLAELRTLPEGLAEQVARLLVAASWALEDDPERALAYAKEAKRKAGRVSVVREALGIASYAAGDYAQALAELRAVRRMTGSDEHVPMMADCERGLERPRKALELLSSVPEDSMDTEMRVECRIVAAGARRDLGQDDAALVLLQIPALKSRSKDTWVARLRYAYADALEAVGRLDDASTWFAKAMEVDEEGLTDAAERLALLEGVTFEEEWEPDTASD